MYKRPFCIWLQKGCVYCILPSKYQCSISHIKYWYVPVLKHLDSVWWGSGLFGGGCCVVDTSQTNGFLKCIHHIVCEGQSQEQLAISVAIGSSTLGIVWRFLESFLVDMMGLPWSTSDLVLRINIFPTLSVDSTWTNQCSLGWCVWLFLHIWSVEMLNCEISSRVLLLIITLGMVARDVRYELLEQISCLYGSGQIVIVIPTGTNL